MATQFKRESDRQAFGGSSEDFKNRCYTFLVVLCNDKDFDGVQQYLDPNCTLVHEDNPPVHGADAFIKVWKQTLAKMPKYHKAIKDIVVEMDTAQPGAARVWVYSQIAGIGSGVRDSVDMMHFTASGLFLDSKDVQREIKQAS